MMVAAKLRQETIDVDLRDPGRGVVAVVREEIARDMAAIKSPAAPSTLAKRRRKGLVSTQWGYVTGRLAATLRAVRASRNTYAIRAARDRLNPETFGARYADVRRRLLLEVPALGNPAQLWRRPRVRREAERQLKRRVRVRRARR